MARRRSIRSGSIRPETTPTFGMVASTSMPACSAAFAISCIEFRCESRTLISIRTFAMRPPGPRSRGPNLIRLRCEKGSGELLRRLAHRDRFHLRRAILEFGDFPERIERGIGEQIGRGLDIGERDKDDAIRHRIVLTRLQF